MKNGGHGYQIQGRMMCVGRSTDCTCRTKGFLVHTLFVMGIVTDMAFRFPRGCSVILVEPLLR